MARVFVSHSSLDNAVAADLFSWLREHGFEQSFLDIDEVAGLKAGGRWEQQLYEQLSRCNAILLVLTPNWHASKWCFAEFVQARSLGKAIFPVVVAPTGDVFVAPDIQQLDLLKDREGGLRRLGAELTQIALDSQGGFPFPPGRPPYPGMLAFERADAAIYFGRDGEIRALIERLEARRVQGGARVVAVLGASGSGKSSLLRAGVLPRLDRYGDNWVVAEPMRPGRQPVAELAKTIAAALGRGTDPDAWRALEARWTADAASFAADVDDVRVRAGRREGRLLVTIDQAEELFAVATPSETERLVALLDAAATTQAPLIVVLTLRSDHLGLLQPLAERLGGVEEFSLAPMPPARYAQIIEGPARVAGLAIGPGLVAAATRDAVDADALPLLAFALRELYDRAASLARASAAALAIGVADYEALGADGGALNPLENAVRRRAEAIVASLAGTPAAVDALRDVFVEALTRIDDDGRYSRRAARWSQIGAAAQDAVRTFIDARLLVSRVDEDGERVVEVAHEALLRKWPRLVAWLDHERDFLLGRQQVDRALADWTAAPPERRDDALLQGLLLERAREWQSGRAQALSEAQRSFIVASAAHADAVRERALRRRRTVWAGALAALVAVTALGVLAVIERRASADLKIDAEADLWRQRSAASLDNGEAERAVGQAAKAWTLRADAKSRSALLQAALDVSPFFVWESRPDAVVRGRAAATLVWSGDAGLVLGDTLGTASAIAPAAQGPASRRVIEVARTAEADLNRPEAFVAATRQADGSLLAVLEDGRILARRNDGGPFRVAGEVGPVRSAAVTRNGVVVVQPDGDDKPIERVACRVDGSAAATCAPARSTGQGQANVRFDAFDATAERIAFAAVGEPLRIVDAAGTVRPVALGASPADGARAVAWHPAGALLAVGTHAGELVVVDGSSGQPVRRMGPTERFRETAFHHLAWAPGGDRIASDCGLASVCVWRLDMPGTMRLEATLAGHATDITALGWNADGTLLASADLDARVRVWRLVDGAAGDASRVALLHMPWAVNDLDVSADGAWLAASDTSGEVLVWDLASRRVAYRLPPGERTAVRAMRLDPGRRWAAIASLDGVRVVEIATGRSTAVSEDGLVETLAWDRHRPWLYLGAQDGSVVRVDLGATPPESQAFPETHAESVLALATDPAAAPERPTVYSADSLGVVLAHGGEQGRVLEIPRAANAPVGLDTLAFSADGRILVAAGNSPDVFVFERAGRRLVARLETGSDQVTTAALSPDGELVAAADNAGRFYLWQTATGTLRATLDLRREPGRAARDPNAGLGQLRRIAWLADGKRVAVATQAGAVVIVPVDTASALARASALAVPSSGARP